MGRRGCGQRKQRNTRNSGVTIILRQMATVMRGDRSMFTTSTITSHALNFTEEAQHTGGAEGGKERRREREIEKREREKE